MAIAPSSARSTARSSWNGPRSPTRSPLPAGGGWYAAARFPHLHPLEASLLIRPTLRNLVVGTFLAVVGIRGSKSVLTGSPVPALTEVVQWVCPTPTPTLNPPAPKPLARPAGGSQPSGGSAR